MTLLKSIVLIMKIPFEILIEDTALNVIMPGLTINPIHNKSLLSIINDYEDKEWRYKIFSQYIWNSISLDAITKEERDSLIYSPDSILEKAASRLRILTYKNGEDEYTGGEIAEILLYGIMQNYYNALSIVPKIFYKQNKNDYAKGADSVHIVVEGDDVFSLWLGEAKFYKSINNSDIDKIIDSVNNMLSSEKIRKENSIITGLSEFEKYDISDSLKKNIKNILNDDISIDKIKPLLHIPILLLYECDITASTEELTDDYKLQIISTHKEKAKEYFSKQIDKCKSIPKYSEIKFHLILFPVPDKRKIVERFIKRAKELRDE